MIIYDSASEDYIKNLLDPELSDLLFVPTYNLSGILSDEDGIIDQVICNKISTELEIFHPGILTLGQTIINSRLIPLQFSDICTTNLGVEGTVIIRKAINPMIQQTNSNIMTIIQKSTIVPSPVLGYYPRSLSIIPSQFESNESEITTTYFILPTEKYMPFISNYAYNIYTTIRVNDPDISRFTGKISLLLKDIDLLPVGIKLPLYSLYIEIISVYYSLLSATKNDGIAILTKSDFDRILNNIRWISLQLELLSFIPYDTLEILRDLQKNLLYIKSLDNLFSPSYESKLQSYYNMIQEVVE